MSRGFVGDIAGTVVGCAGELARGGVGGTVLDGGVAVAEIAEVVDIAWGEEGAGCEGVDGSVAPLSQNTNISFPAEPR